MCGIAGVATTARGRGLGTLTVDSLSHRGPDAAGRQAWSGQRSGWELAHTRLAIVDLSPAGEQPMHSSDGSLVMVFNGEIYNSPELRRYCEQRGCLFSSHMDGEVILNLWLLEGPSCLRKLNGIFAFAMASTVTGEVFLARDPVGVKPLFYSVARDSTLWFASEINALKTSGAEVGSQDPVAIAQFLSFLWIPDPRTPFENAKTLEPGQALRWGPDGWRIFSYGDPLVPNPVDDGASGEDRLEQAEAHLRAAAQRQLLGDVPIALMASGGVDSSLLWWAATDAIAQAYTISWSADDDFEHLDDDRLAVRQLQSRFGTPVDYLRGEAAGTGLPRSGDLFADPAYELTRLVATTARAQGYKVLLSGQGADELFAGYRRHAAANFVGRLRLGGIGKGLEHVVSRIPVGRLSGEYASRLARASAEAEPFAAYMQMCTYSTPDERAKVLDANAGDVSNEVVWQRHREVFDRLPTGLSFLRQAMALDLAVYLPGLGLAYVDRAGMECGVEIRVPWLDLELVRWSLTLPDGALVRRTRGKWLTRDLAARKLARNIGHRPKRGFAAPISQVATDSRSAGSARFRQGVYFSHATELLRTHSAASEQGLAEAQEEP